MSKKSFFLKFFNLRKKEISDISAHQALVLQKGYIDDLSRNKTETATPPYMNIASQLESKKSEVFRAAVYYLVRIAENESDQSAAILDILKSTQRKKLPADDLQYLKSQIKKLES